MKIIARGAEAVLRKDRRQGEAILLKDRIRKGYRVKELDQKIRSQRTKTEERLLARARRAGVQTPRVWEASGSEIEMEWLEGPTVKESLNSMPKKERLIVYEEIGRSAASLHRTGIMHGDLTTSNMIIRDGRPNKLFLIDFGLAKTSQRVEDYAVDLFLLNEALKAAHFRFLDEAWKNIIKAYKYNYSIARQILERLEKIERRRRYRGE
jgi:TP53 regulating kinase-like protein